MVGWIKKYLIMANYAHIMNELHAKHWLYTVLANRFNVYNVSHKTSKGMRDMNYQYTMNITRATMLNNLPKPLLVLCGVMARLLFRIITNLQLNGK